MSDQEPMAAAESRPDHRQSPGTVLRETLAAQGRARRAPDGEAVALPGWPRLLNLALAAQYLSISRDTLLSYVAGGNLEPVRPKRPDTARAYRQRPADDRLRKLLFDRSDLDRLADGWR